MRRATRAAWMALLPVSPFTYAPYRIQGLSALNAVNVVPYVMPTADWLLTRSGPLVQFPGTSGLSAYWAVTFTRALPVVWTISSVPRASVRLDAAIGPVRS